MIVLDQEDVLALTDVSKGSAWILMMPINITQRILLFVQLSPTFKRRT